MTKEIKLTNEYSVLVDDEDYEELIKYRWYITPEGYAYRFLIDEDGKRHTLYMHRNILKTKKGLDVDHIDYDTLNNQKSNLREAARSNNLAHSKPHKKYAETHSQYRGVYWHKRAMKWVTGISNNGKSIHLGLFLNEKDAAKAYNNAAERIYKEFATLNKI